MSSSEEAAVMDLVERVGAAWLRDVHAQLQILTVGMVQRVYGSALPTIQGIRAVLEQVGCSPKSSDEDYQVWPHKLYVCRATSASYSRLLAPVCGLCLKSGSVPAPTADLQPCPALFEGITCLAHAQGCIGQVTRCPVQLDEPCELPAAIAS